MSGSRSVSLHLEASELWLAFLYDASTVTALKSLKVGARWDPDRRGWHCPDYHRHEVEWLFQDLGYRLVWSERPGSLSDQTMLNPFSEVFAILPTDLRIPVYRSLARCLHPDAGGDTEFMKLLNRAYDALAS